MAFGGAVKIVDIQVVRRAAGSDGDSFFALKVYGPEADICRTKRDSSARKLTPDLRARQQTSFPVRTQNFCKSGANSSRDLFGSDFKTSGISLLRRHHTQPEFLQRSSLGRALSSGFPDRAVDKPACALL